MVISVLDKVRLLHILIVEGIHYSKMEGTLTNMPVKQVLFWGCRNNASSLLDKAPPSSLTILMYIDLLLFNVYTMLSLHECLLHIMFSIMYSLYYRIVLSFQIKKYFIYSLWALI